MEPSKQKQIATALIAGLAVALVVSISLLIFKNKKLSGSNPITRIFTPEMIGADLAYLEQITGPALSTYGEIKTYVLGRCELEVSTDGQSIGALSINVSPKCTFDLGAFAMTGKKVPAHRLTFDQFTNVISEGSVILSDCLLGCGNAYDPAVYVHSSGSRANDFIEIMGSSMNTYKSNDLWVQTMIQNEGEEWVMDGLFNCNPMKYRDMARQALHDEPIEKITIGRELGAHLVYGCDQPQ